MKEEEVAQYLLDNPEFFVQHSDVLEKLTLPHPINGKVISLLEYQVVTLRNSAKRYQGQFEKLIDVARENESTMQKSRRLILAGLTCETVEDLSIVVSDMVRDDFAIAHHALVLFADLPDSSVRTHQITENDPLLAHTAGLSECFCGVLPKNEMKYLFSDDAEKIRSVAVLPLLSRVGGVVDKRAVLVLGSEQESAFDKGKGMFFLQHLADSLSAILLRLLP